jgi:hypothetical protein
VSVPASEEPSTSGGGSRLDDAADRQRSAPGSPVATWPSAAPDVDHGPGAGAFAEGGTWVPAASPPQSPFARWGPRAANAFAVGAVIAVVLWQMHLPLILSNTSTTGGDTGAHFMMPAYFNTLFPHLTGWDPSWYDGYPDYTFYFVLPDVLVALAAHVIPYDIAFKLGTVVGSLLLPVTAWALGRLFGLRGAAPAALAAATLPFLFDYTWTIYGGNLLSTLAGEYAYSLSVALMVLFLGLFARGLRTGRYRAWAALTLAACVLAHVVPAALAIAGAALLTLLELLPEHWRLRDDVDFGPSSVSGSQVVPVPRGRVATLWWAVSTVSLGVLLAAWWLVPFLLRQDYATSMNYSKVTSYTAIFFPRADLWALVLAGLAVVVAVLKRSRFGVVMAFLGGLSALAVVFDPSRSLYNVRFLPLWFLFVYLMAGWLFGVSVAAAARWVRHRRLTRWVLQTGADRLARPVGDGSPALQSRLRARPPVAPWSPGAVGGSVLAVVAALAVVVPPFVPGLVPSLARIGVRPGPNQVTVWSDWNYTGYAGKADYPEYHGLMLLMDRIGRADGCGRAMWEYNADENRFGTPEALMLLPYWTTGCVDSMEGLLFESSATTPFHFLNQAELSASPSEAVVGLPYGQLTVHLGVQHLQLLGVRYFMAASPQVEEEANADPTLRLLATSGPWNTTYQGQRLSTTWKVYEVMHSEVVTPLADQPAVLTGVGNGQTTWLGRIGSGNTMTEGPALRWYLDPADWGTELVAGGPPAWQRTTGADATDPPAVAVAPTTVTDVHESTQSISFHVGRTGTPVLVKISYFPNWHATGAEGPWRATPNLMVVVPTSHHVTLTFGTTALTEAADLATGAAVACLAALAVWWLVLRRRERARIG